MSAPAEPEPAPAAYPPEHHILRDLLVVTQQETPERSISVAPLTEHVRNAAGAAGLGTIAAVVDVNCALVALLAATPDWTATADLALHEVAPLTDGPIIVTSQLVRAGVNIVVVDVEVHDGHGQADPAARDATKAGVGLVTMARIPASASAVSSAVDRTAVIGTKRSMATDDSGFTQPVLDSIGVRVVDAARGVVELDKHDYVRNSFGTINGGVLGMLFQAAAEAMAGGHGTATDVQIHYLSQTRTGPARTAGTEIRTTADHAVYRIEAVDAGQDDQLLAVATVTVRR